MYFYFINNLINHYLWIDVKYVIFGVPEDIGVFGNHGNSGSSKAWDATLNALLNIQSNAYTNPKSVLLLGHLDFSEELDRVSQLNPSKKKHIKIIHCYTIC